MKFHAETKPQNWTLDNSIPILVRSNKSDEYIFQMALNKLELEQLKEEIEIAINLLEKSGGDSNG